MVRLLVYLAVFALGVVFGGAFPGYAIQYQQRLYGQFEQVSTDLAPFQEIADRYHHGSLQALVDYHLRSRDPTFHDEGVAIQAMLLNQQRLAEATTALAASPLEQAAYLYRHLDPELARSTWEAYTPMLITTSEALVFAVSVGIAFWLVAFLAVRLTVVLGRRPGATPAP